MNYIEEFDGVAAQKINVARLDHLASLGLNISRKSVLETACGIGHLTGFFEVRGCSVIGIELQASNIAENLSRHPKRAVIQDDLSRCVFPGKFDIGFCYGTLYHLTDPERFLCAMADVCREMLLIETLVHGVDDGQLHQYTQFAGANQGPSLCAMVPSRDWMMTTLKKYFRFAYSTRTQPKHKEFPTRWPNSQSPARAVFVASHLPIDNNALVDHLLNDQ